MRNSHVISVQVFEKNGYNYLREIILGRADIPDTRSQKKEFKKKPSSIMIFEDPVLLNIQKAQPSAQDRQDQSSHSSQHVDKKPADYYFKEDYTIVPFTKPRAVVYRDRLIQRKLMRLNELHKFSDGTLTRVMEKLDQMVKDFHLYEYNKGMETRKWSEDDKRRSKTSSLSIREKTQIRRIYQV
ncbi:hypothetical protein Tco_0289419 [Tanacetum coccineum]